ncbi:MAG: hypothetical protein S4CHLAM45_10980 [Chlamydiales bacterium]|nr:hypothetical protein [Chlamydiales bacterium]MCH9619590.1 hypothetical protein [Chlamydiales bacterium]MCH9623196.1 hypothetical protein [Chlamydiales bacterium]
MECSGIMAGVKDVVTAPVYGICGAAEAVGHCVRHTYRSFTVTDYLDTKHTQESTRTQNNLSPRELRWAWVHQFVVSFLKIIPVLGALITHFMDRGDKDGLRSCEHVITGQLSEEAAQAAEAVPSKGWFS